KWRSQQQDQLLQRSCKRIETEWNAACKTTLIGMRLLNRTRKKNAEKDQTAKKQKGDELEKENAEKQKLEEQREAEELKRNLKIVPEDEDDVFVNVAPLSSK
nr:hypothetical protein [Tanacetum cinerariifolium]